MLSMLLMTGPDIPEGCRKALNENRGFGAVMDHPFGFKLAGQLIEVCQLCKQPLHSRCRLRFKCRERIVLIVARLCRDTTSLADAISALKTGLQIKRRHVGDMGFPVGLDQFEHGIDGSRDRQHRNNCRRPGERRRRSSRSYAGQDDAAG
ncbi:MAG: hypothetical protein WAU79_24045 [Bradyrhizobium sp.]|uniref:hypothetical protein n=1 Tax=Bradyrhizobium sp. TaxID=376 RepID=UPI003BAF6BEE